jgi:membrane-bound inhibitor of C-type lysozyme
MDRKTLAAFVVVVMLIGCRGGGWTPWSRSSGEAPRLPPGAKGYACEGGKRLIVRVDADAKSAWVIYPDREFRLTRVTSDSGERYSNNRTTLSINGAETTLEESGQVQFANCKPE